MTRHFLSMFDWSPDELRAMLERAKKLKAARGKPTRGKLPLAGKTVALIFEKASTRTRVSFEVGVQELGGHPMFISAKDSQLGRGEPIRDTARVFSRYVHMIMLRTFAQATLDELARFSTVPVINGLSDKLHPCQVLADLQTVAEHKGPRLERWTVAWVGDGNNMANSWIEAAAQFGFPLRAACPPGFKPDAAVLAEARRRGGRIEVFDRPEQAVAGADVVNTDVWASMGQEAEAERRRQAFAGYLVDEALMARANPGAIFLHCLPAHRGEEVADAVIEGPASRVWDEAENRLHAQKAIMERLLQTAD
ncbi:MAG: ornithine carbamoyltransferase [Deltaproteobacteria bacterium]|nr:ornithine carbamoyltransferase [Deltaproteobacteria bacterium]